MSRDWILPDLYRKVARVFTTNLGGLFNSSEIAWRSTKLHCNVMVWGWLFLKRTSILTGVSSTRAEVIITFSAIWDNAFPHIVESSVNVGLNGVEIVLVGQINSHYRLNNIYCTKHTSSPVMRERDLISFVLEMCASAAANASTAPSFSTSAWAKSRNFSTTSGEISSINLAKRMMITSNV